jgi:hypothetical protein
MSALPLLDYALSSAVAAGGVQDRQAQARLTQFAESLVRSVLDDLDRVELFERAVRPADDHDDNEPRFDRDAAVLVRFSYEECMKHAEQVLQRVNRLESRGHQIQGADTLRDAHGRLSAMLSVSLDQVALAQEQAKRGEVHPATELRHELRDRLHK